MLVLVPSTSDILENLPERMFSKFCFKGMHLLTSFLKNKCCLWGRGAWCLRGTKAEERKLGSMEHKCLHLGSAWSRSVLKLFLQHHHPQLLTFLVPTIWMSLLFPYFLASCPFPENFPRDLMFCSAARFATCCRGNNPHSKARCIWHCLWERMEGLHAGGVNVNRE